MLMKRILSIIFELLIVNIPTLLLSYYFFSKFDSSYVAFQSFINHGIIGIVFYKIANNCSLGMKIFGLEENVNNHKNIYKLYKHFSWIWLFYYVVYMIPRKINFFLGIIAFLIFHIFVFIPEHKGKTGFDIIFNINVISEHSDSDQII